MSVHCVCERSSEGYADEDPVLTIFTVTFTAEGNRDFISLQVVLIQLTFARTLANCSPCDSAEKSRDLYSV